MNISMKEIEKIVGSASTRIPLNFRTSKTEAAKFLMMLEGAKVPVINPGVQALRRWLDDDRDVDDFDQVVSIEKYGQETTYDFTVPDGASFGANGLTVHNCNVPNDTSVDLVSRVYMRAWEKGCKGFTVYREGSRTGVLISTDSKEETTTTKIIERNAPKRPEELPCEIHQTTIKGEKWTIIVGLLDGRPYEVMGGLSSTIELPSKYHAGKIRKRSRKSMRSYYDLVVGEGEGQLVVRDLVETFQNPNHTAFTRTISLALRHGVPVNYMVDQLMKDKDADFWSLSRVIARVLKKYIEDGAKAGNTQMDGCQQPGQCNLVYREGCVSCVTCTASRCG